MEKTKIISLNVKPEKGIGPFQIGMTVNEIISELKALGEKIGLVDIVSSEESMDSLFICVVQEGLEMKFDPNSQKLKSIKLKANNEGKRHFSYTIKDHPILVASGDFECKFNYFSNIVGPTQVVDIKGRDDVFLANSKGMSVMFFNGSQENKSNADFDKLSVFGTTEEEKERLGNFFQVMMYEDRIVIKFDAEEETVITLGDESETIIYKLKNPNFIQREHCSNDSKKVSYYVLNYFNFGLDFIISNKTHKLKKIVAHTNNPNDPAFGLYDRCNFKLIFSKDLVNKVGEMQGKERKMSDFSSSFQVNEESIDQSKAEESQFDAELLLGIEQENFSVEPTTDFNRFLKIIDQTLEKKTRCESKLGVTFSYYTVENFKIEVIDSTHQITSVSI